MTTNQESGVQVRQGHAGVGGASLESNLEFQYVMNLRQEPPTSGQGVQRHYSLV